MMLCYSGLLKYYTDAKQPESLINLGNNDNTIWFIFLLPIIVFHGIFVVSLTCTTDTM
jgi:hypothetical protein